MTATGAPAGEARRVLICENCPTYAAGLSALLARDPEIDVVGVCSSAEETIARLARLDPQPHLVTMDLELPGMSGGEAIEQIMSAQPLPILVLTDGVHNGSRTALMSLGAGALEVASKDALDLRDPDGAQANAFRRRIKLLSSVPVLNHPRARLRHRKAAGADHGSDRAAVIGICASAGGPRALAAVLSEIPHTFAIPILVVQHMAGGLTEGFARWLDDQVALPVRLAPAGPIGRGIWVAPEGAHLVLDRVHRLASAAGEEGELHRPSGDALLGSLAASAGLAGVAVVLTGMGHDGAGGLRQVGRAGGLTIAQDQASSVVFGMPKAAAEAGAELVLAPVEIGRRLGVLRAVGWAA
jgi:two-component system, chemotaxis family, protein-glutamate methylesterase/glutaminase